MSDKLLCIYHNNCADGFGAAWAVRHALGEDNVEFYPGVHQEPPPDVTGRYVCMVDFSYKRDVLLQMAEQAQMILILDHHQSAEKDLVDLPDNVEAVFDMDHSGAMLAWDYFNDNEPPQLLRHIEDRDLWRFELPFTRQIQAALFSYPYDFAIWDALMDRPVNELAAEGEAIERKHFKDIHELIAAAAHDAEVGGHQVPVLNCPYFFSSDAAHILGEGKPFAACYYDTADYRNFSLRSAKEGGLDVSEVAAGYGGGGHRNAAGFKVPKDHPLAQI